MQVPAPCCNSSNAVAISIGGQSLKRVNRHICYTEIRPLTRDDTPVGNDKCSFKKGLKGRLAVVAVVNSSISVIQLFSTVHKHSSSCTFPLGCNLQPLDICFR